MFCCTTSNSYPLPHPDTQREARNERRPLLEICSQEVDDPANERANARSLLRSSRIRGVEQVLEALICMPTNNVVCIKGKQCLVQCHIRYLTIKLLHDKIKLKQANWKRRIRVVSIYKIRRMMKKRPQLTIHIAYQVLLEIKLLGQI